MRNRNLVIFSQPSTPGLVNFKKSNTARAKAALNSIKSGASSYYWAWLGESNIAGWGSGTGLGGHNNARVNSVAWVLGADLTADLAIPTDSCAFCQDAGYTFTEFTSTYTYDPQFNFSGDLTGWSAPSSSSGGGVPTNSTTTNPYIWTPRIPINKFAITYARNAGYATFTVTVDGVVKATINASGAQAVVRAEVDCGSVGTHTIQVARNGTGGNLLLLTLDAYDDTRKSLRMLNFGQGGASIAGSYNNTTNAWSNASFLGWMAQNLPLAAFVIHLGTANDKDTDHATYIANYGSIIDRLTPYVDVIVAQPFPQNPANWSGANTQADVRGWNFEIAQIKGLPVVDPFPSFIDNATAQARGWSGDVHLSALGHSAGYAPLFEKAVKAILR